MKKVTKWVALLLAIFLLATPVLAASGAVQANLYYRNIKIQLNGKEVTATDINGQSTEPFIMNNSTYLPVRSLAEALGFNVEWNNNTSTVSITSKAVETPKTEYITRYVYVEIPANEDEKDLYVLHTQAGDWNPQEDTNDGVYIKGVADKYFNGGTEVGLEALLNAGKVYVNGIQIPADEGTFYMNGMPAIWEKSDGVWTWQAHDKLNSDSKKIDHNGDYSFEFARRRFVLAVSALRGTTMTISGENGSDVACRVDFDIKSGGQVEKIVANDNGTTTVWGVPIDATSYNTDGGPNDVQPRTIPTANFDQTIEEGDTVLYWYDTTGWHMERCVPETGLMTSTGHFDINVNGKTYSDALIVRYNMQAGSRPSQFISAANNLELGNIPVTLWLTKTGYVVGISHMENAKEALEASIEFVGEKLGGRTIVASSDGSDVPIGSYWVTQSTLDTFNAASENAKRVLANPSSTNAQMDAATQQLGAAYGSGTKGMAAMKEGSYKGTLLKAIVIEKPMMQSATNCATSEKYNLLYEGNNAVNGVNAIIAAGRCYINGYAIPATEAEFNADCPNGYLVNGSAWLSKTADGYKVDKKTYTSYTEAANATLANLNAGLEVRLYDLNGDGYADIIDADYLEAVIVNKIVENTDGSYRIYRTDIDSTTEKAFDGSHFTSTSDDVIKAENFDTTIKEGDMGLFWYGTDGWAMKRAVEIYGILVDGQDHGTYNIGGIVYTDAMRFSRDNIVISNRCGEFVNAHKYFGFNNNADGLKISLWLVPTIDSTQINGAPAGFTDKNAKEFLTKAIAIAKEKLNSVTVSEDGTGLAAGTKWVKQAAYDELTEMITRAESVLISNASNDLCDYQIYLLYLKLHGSADDIGAKYAGYNYVGFDNAIYTA